MARTLTDLPGMADLTSARARGTVAVVLGVVALVGYGLFGASPASPDLPAAHLGLAALLVVAGVAIREGRSPRWGEVVAAALAAYLAFDLVLRLLA